MKNLHRPSGNNIHLKTVAIMLFCHSGVAFANLSLNHSNNNDMII